MSSSSSSIFKISFRASSIPSESSDPEPDRLESHVWIIPVGEINTELNHKNDDGESVHFGNELTEGYDSEGGICETDEFEKNICREAVSSQGKERCLQLNEDWKKREITTLSQVQSTMKSHHPARIRTQSIDSKLRERLSQYIQHPTKAILRDVIAKLVESGVRMNATVYEVFETLLEQLEHEDSGLHNGIFDTIDQQLEEVAPDNRQTEVEYTKKLGRQK